MVSIYTIKFYYRFTFCLFSRLTELKSAVEDLVKYNDVVTHNENTLDKYKHATNNLPLLKQQKEDVLVRIFCFIFIVYH